MSVESGDLWTAQEHDVLAKICRDGGPNWVKRAVEALPHRSRASCAVRASNYGLRTNAPKPFPYPRVRQQAPPESPLPVVERTEIIIGYRVWRVVSNGRDAVLRSVWGGDPWPCGAPLIATTLSQRGKDGIHAFARPVTIAEYGYALPLESLKGELLVHGEVALGGRIIEHEHGYRAQYAYPVAICKCAGTFAQMIARSYGLETVLVPSHA